MNEQDAPAIHAVLARVGEVFGVPVEALNPTSRFGADLQASPVSDFKENELDQILGDIQEIKEGTKGKDLSIEEVHTVGEFSALVEQFQRMNPSGCLRLLQRWEKERQMTQRPCWRRAIFRVTGF